MTQIRSTRPFIHTLKRVECLKEGLEAGVGMALRVTGGAAQQPLAAKGQPVPPRGVMSPGSVLAPGGFLSPGDILSWMEVLSPRDIMSCMVIPSPRDILSCIGVLSLRDILFWKGDPLPKECPVIYRGLVPKGHPSLDGCPLSEGFSVPTGCPVPDGQGFPAPLHRTFPPCSHQGTAGCL